VEKYLKREGGEPLSWGAKEEERTGQDRTGKGKDKEE